MVDKETIENFIYNMIKHIALKPELLKVTASRVGYTSEGYYVELATTYHEDAARLIGKNGYNKRAIRQFIGMALLKNGYIKSFEDIEIRIPKTTRG